MELVCDNSELNGIWGAEAPDVIVIGGYSIARDKIPTLLKQTKDILARHGLDPHCPFKWNMKDLDRALLAHDLMHQKAVLLSKSNPLRTDLLTALMASGATIFASAILAHSNKKQVLGRTREDLIGYSFGNLLMRAGLCCEERGAAQRVDVILDWPERNDRVSFVNEYHTGWRYGRSGKTENAVNYSCGPLAELGFASSPVFAGVEFEPKLQLADLVVGTVREFVTFALGKSSITNFGVESFKTLLPSCYQRKNGQILGLGLTVSPTRSDFSKAILAGLEALRGNAVDKR